HQVQESRRWRYDGVRWGSLPGALPTGWHEERRWRRWGSPRIAAGRRFMSWALDSSLPTDGLAGRLPLVTFNDHGRPPFAWSRGLKPRPTVSADWPSATTRFKTILFRLVGLGCVCWMGGGLGRISGAETS